MTTKTTTKRTYKITQYQGSNRLATGSDGQTYISHKTASGRWSRWTRAKLTAI